VPSLEQFCVVNVELQPRMLGRMPQGTRIDFAFQGTATSDHWDGERPVRGVDYVTVRGDGHMDLDIRATIGEKRETVAYRASGVSVVRSENEAFAQELITFQTGNEDLAWLNQVVGIGLGGGEGGKMTLTIYVVRP
jgi:hypothetical protein